jgi:hypothetical protein
MENSMHNSASSQIIARSFVCLFVLEAAAVAILLLVRRNSQLKSIGRALHAFASKALLALPGVVTMDILMLKMNLIPWQPFLFVVGATSSWAFFEVCTSRDRAF